MENEDLVTAFKNELRSRFVKSFLDILVLRLVQAGPKWGYDIIKKTEAEYNIKIRHGALYPLLSRLEMEGLLKSRKELRKGRIRKVYEITQIGRQALHSCQDFLRQQTS